MATNQDEKMMPDSETQEMLGAFVSEAFDSLDTAEPIVDELLNDDNEESVNTIFRVFHTLKGLSGFFEMKIINKVTHIAENMLDIMRKQNKPQSEESLTIIYQSFDFLRDLLQRVSSEFSDLSGEEEAEDLILIIQDGIAKLSDSATTEDITAKETSTEEQVIDLSDNNNEQTQEEVIETNDEDDVSSLLDNDMLEQYLTNAIDLLDIIEKNLLDLEKSPNNEQIIEETFRSIHSLKGNSGFMGFSEIEASSADIETILGSIRDKELDIDENIISILLSNSESIRKLVDELEQKTLQAEQEAKGSIKEQEKIDEIKLEEIKPIEVKETTRPTGQPKKKTINKKPLSKGKKPPKMQRKDIRVETVKIDKLFDMVGELITIESLVENNPDIADLNLPNFSKSVNMLNKITRELQEISMSIRMMPLDGMFNKMKRLVRDVSIKMEKKVELSIFGQDTEMDKNVIDEISDPLVHILRNSIDHGIEKPSDRLAKGKLESGIVKLGAKYEGNEILIVVEDDGAGIDREVILRKAEEKGILTVPPESMSDKEVFALLFEPGFSTAKVVTDISGRGVGMDVVRKNIEKLRGKVTIDSKLGKGSVFTLRIPLTLAILESMILRIGDAFYAAPLLSVKEAFRPNQEQINITMDGLEIVKVRDDILPIIRLHQLLKKKPDSERLEDGILIIIESGEKNVCLFVDEIIGQQQAVIKSLSEYIGKVSGLTGCMILGDGSIGLILDIESIIKMTEKVELEYA